MVQLAIVNLLIELFFNLFDRIRFFIFKGKLACIHSVACGFGISQDKDKVIQ
jgi:hypothetical protein